MLRRLLRPLAEARSAELAETRASYTDAVLDALLAAAAGNGASPSARGSAAVEAAAGIVERAFSGVTVENSERVARALTPSVLGLIGRSLILRGESLHVIRVAAGRLALLPASSWQWYGRSPDPEDWTVEAHLAAPGGHVSVRIPWASVLHVAAGRDPSRPWAGTSGHQGSTAALLAATERALHDDATTPTGGIIPIPKLGDPLKTKLQNALAALRGGLLLGETSREGYGDRSQAPARDYQVQRVGPAAPAGLAAARTSAAEAVTASCGVPPALVIGNADGTSQRESLRRLWIATVIPLLRLLLAEVRGKLEQPGAGFRFDPYVLDLVGRASAFGRLQAAEVEDAREVTGLAELGRVR